MARRDRITGETECGCGCYAGQHEIERGEDGIEYGACRAFGGCLAADGEECRDFHLPEPVVAVVDVQLVNEAEASGWPTEGLKAPVTVTYTHDVHDPDLDLSACTRRIGCPSPLHHVDCRALFEARIEDDDPDPEDGPLNDDWIAAAYEKQAELREAGLLDEGP